MYGTKSSKNNHDAHYERGAGTFDSRDAQVQNVKSSRVYVFGDTDVTEDEINTDSRIEMTTVLRSRGPNKDHEDEEPDEIILERPIHEGDSLQSTALKYGCPVSELKRVNNLITDQDFYALKVIKVPAKRHGLLTELIQDEKLKSNGAVGANYDVNFTEAAEGDEYISGDESQNLLVRNVSIRGSFRGKSDDHNEFLRRMDHDIKKIVTSKRDRLDSLEKVVERLTCKNIHPLQAPKTSILSGADCGIRWWTVVAVMFLIGLATPLLYFVYYEYYKPH